MKLTRRERYIAKRCAYSYRSFIIQRGYVIGWIGVILFAIGLQPIIDVSKWIQSLSFDAGFSMVILSVIAELIKVSGKLYEHVERSKHK